MKSTRLLTLTLLAVSTLLFAQNEDQAAVVPMATSKFAILSGIPACAKISVQHTVIPTRAPQPC